MIKKLFTAFLVTLALVVSILPATVFASDTLFEYYNTGYDNLANIGYENGDYVGGQTFTPSATHNLTSIKLKLFRTGTVGTINCFLFATSSGLPTGSYLRYVSYNGDSITTNTNGEWIEFKFGSAYTVNSGTKYCIVLDVPNGSSGNVIYWMEDISSPSYSGGNKVFSTDGSVTFTAYSGTDMYFEEYGTYPPATPSIIANDASNITQYEARLNSTVSNDGYEACDVRFGYGTTTQTAANFANYDTLTSWIEDTYSSGEKPYVDITGLTADTTYYFRVQIKNSAGTATSNELSFKTLSSFTAPTNFRASTESTSINLFWTKGTGASTTMIRYSYGEYPATSSDGILLYNGTGSNTTHTGIAPGTTVYYSAWSISGANESAAVNLIATTLIEEEGDVGLTEPSEPTNWFLDIDCTTMENFEPVYSTVNDIADEIDMPHNTFWFLGAITLSVLAGFGVYTWRKSFLGAGLATLLCMIIASAVSLIPGFLIFLCFIILIALGAAGRRFGV